MSKMKSSLGRGLDALINPNRFNETVEQKNPDYSNIKFDDGKQIDILAKIAVDFIKNHMIDVTEYSFDNFLDSSADEQANKNILGIKD